MSHDPSEIILICWCAAQEHFLLLSWVSNIDILWMLDSFQESSMNITFKRMWHHKYNIRSISSHVLINLMHPCWIKVLISLKNIHAYMCVCVRACVCVCVHVYVVYEDTHLYNDMVWHRYYKEKVIYEDIFSVLIIQNAYFKWVFLGGEV